MLGSQPFALCTLFSFSSSLSKRALCLLMYMLQRANMKNAIANSALVRLFSNRFSAVTSIIMKLVSCSASSSLAFIVLFGILVELPKNKVAFPVFYH